MTVDTAQPGWSHQLGWDAMAQVNVQDAETRPSDLVARAEQGEEIVTARAGVPVARLVALKNPPPRGIGGASFVVPDDFDAPLTGTELSAWE